MVNNLVAHLKAGVRPDIIDRVLEYWGKVHPGISAGIAQGLGVPVKTAPRTSGRPTAVSSKKI
jgi:catalase